jgi:hypothetical protein
MVPRNDKALVAIAPERIRRLREHLINRAAYDRYRRDVFATNIANERQMTAQINEMDWGPWGVSGRSPMAR